MFRTASRVIFTRHPYARRFSPTLLGVANLSQTTTKSLLETSTKNTVQRIGRHVLRFTLFAFASIVIVYEGAHLYVERVQMAPETDPEVKKWEWDLINSDWTGDLIKGGFKARHIIRAAFSTYHNDVQDSTVVVEEENSEEHDQSPGLTHVVDARLYETERHLNNAISLIEGNLANDDHSSHAFCMLLIRHADVLEQLGHRMHLMLAKDDYQRAWQHCKTPQYREFIAYKLGDLNSRLGRSTEAMKWWNISTQLIQERNHESVGVSTGYQSIPHSPLAQRILASILVSKSAYLAASGNIVEAQTIEESALNFLRSIRHPDSIATTSPPQALHAAYLLQRSSLLFVHQAEVFHAQRQPVNVSIQWLASAAESSERVADILTGAKFEPKSKSDRSSPLTRPKTSVELLSVYASSPSMNGPAKALLRDARRTAAEAWNMMGILHEQRDGRGSRSALECFERALSWAGTVEDDNKSLGPAKDTLHSDWHIYWSNYQRAKNIQASSN
ncbi:hypothetical protein JR316_0003765 [Psilocybe cubensis]|uniref:Uncharacterized protein n=1 Tax=Psilocybe cubensis TaxID=181762 RepID=A0ACB8H8Y1_PSICU|nr:hypothetical protein JR316_0003765 [Psilocybe cubensis]KAH9484284.1 hypothetical protein JR316_0003765 [Psilocybe cubensis]